ncbi:hypothetical protein NC653_005884 [Populus alba x Populus x berolinensis]|uniref:Glutaredoxin-like protein n=1 Tax=Populus alba x Populus x berolinensis TaxID=444605 RepID=A0AAD6RDF1_9ROSI|nr:hypothetical protein NC653_005884 [Populus alba x Populus x berolinensis]
MTLSVEEMIMGLNETRKSSDTDKRGFTAMAIATIAAVATKPSSIPLLTRKRPKWIFTPLAFCSSSSSSASRRKLILYSKPGCCLCDGLKEKLQAAFLLSGPHSLHDVDLQDITAILNGRGLTGMRYPFWPKYSLMAPSDIGKWQSCVLHTKIMMMKYVLSPPPPSLQFSDLLLPETLPRISPRLGVELVHKKDSSCFDPIRFLYIIKILAGVKFVIAWDNVSCQKRLDIECLL